MNISLLLEMASAGCGERIAVGSRDGGTSYDDLLDLVRRSAARITASGAERVVLLDVNSDLVPGLFFGSALAGAAFVPVNYRLAEDRRRAIIERSSPCLAVAMPSMTDELRQIDGAEVLSSLDLRAQLADSDVDSLAPAPDDASQIASLLFTSGTTGEPKAAVLRHANLFSYITETVEFLSADADECALVSVPPYHIAGLSAVLSSVYAGRRLYYLEQFDAKEWVRAVEDEGVTHAMVVPTMLDRILDVVEEEGASLSTLRHLSYGGGRMPLSVVTRAMAALPHAALVNAYGLTETSSTISVLTPEDHRVAWASNDPEIRARLGSVGRPIANLELEIRDLEGQPCPVGEAGEVWVRGPQVSGEYLGTAGTVSDGWFCTRDAGRLDAGGYLFLEGRLDDVIVRGGENMSPGEIEDVIATHPAVNEVAVVGIPDAQWGEVVAAVLVLNEGAAVDAEEIKDLVRAQLRSSRVPAKVAVKDELPYNETGKLLRRVLREELAADSD